MELSGLGYKVPFTVKIKQSPSKEAANMNSEVAIAIEAAYDQITSIVQWCKCFE